MPRILLVDDEAPVRDVVARLLSGEGHEVQTAANGNEALKLAETQSFDLLLIDLVMPEKEGIETIVQWRRLYPAIQIIAMSGRIGATANLQMAEKLGASRTLLKPFSKQELLMAVMETLRNT